MHVPLQLICPDGQTQLVPEQTPPIGQGTQVPPQLDIPAGQTQTPLMQVAPVGQTLPQAPQLSWSEVTGWQAPGAPKALPVQLNMPVGQSVQRLWRHI
jgi:hypothetical protein